MKRQAAAMAARHYTKRLAAGVFRGWRDGARESAVATSTKQLQAQHERHVIEIANEYQLKIEQVRRNFAALLVMHLGDILKSSNAH